MTRPNVARPYRSWLITKPACLARVIGLFSGRGYNIDSLTVAPVDDAGRRSRINIVTSGTSMVIEQIKAQLDRLVPVHRVADLTMEGPHVARELALVKVICTGEQRVEALQMARRFGRGWWIRRSAASCSS